MESLSIYLDTSALVPFFLADPFVPKARAFLRTEPIGLVISDFAAAEFASVLGNRVRMKLLTLAEARTALSHFDVWTARAATSAELALADVRTASAFLRRLDLTLRTPDALNLAIAQRLNAELATFDRRMAVCARSLGLPLVSL
jgi:predicted nucleic acid-binding protein